MESEAAQAEVNNDQQAEEEEIVWEVKTVLDKRIDPVTGNVEYLLEWKKWDGPPTWEPEENCDCKSLIKKFEKEIKQRQSSSSLTNRQSSARSQTPAKTPRKSARRQSNTTPQPKEPTITPITSPSQLINLQQPVILESTPKPTQAVLPIETSSQPTTSKSQQVPKRPLPMQVRATKLKQNYPPLVQSNNPRSQSPGVIEIDSSCSEADDVVDKYDQLFRERRLKLKEIVGAVNCGDNDDTVLIVKWHGINELEKVPLQVLRKFYCQDIVDFLIARIRWQD